MVNTCASSPKKRTLKRLRESYRTWFGRVFHIDSGVTPEMHFRTRDRLAHRGIKFHELAWVRVRNCTWQLNSQKKQMKSMSSNITGIRTWIWCQDPRWNSIPRRPKVALWSLEFIRGWGSLFTIHAPLGLMDFHMQPTICEIFQTPIC